MAWDDEYDAAEWDERPDDTYEEEVDTGILWTQPDAKDFEDFVEEVRDGDE